MSAAATNLRPPAEKDEPRALTLLELIWALGEVTEDDREVVVTALEMLRSGRVRLSGNFRNCPVDELA